MSFLPKDRAERMAVLSLPLLVALVYAVAFPGHFFMDDAQIVLQNMLVYAPDLKLIMTSDYWGRGENTGLFRPLTIISFALNNQFFGEHPWGYLLINVVMHAGVCMLFYTWLRRLAWTGGAAWLAAALFAVHPIHGEAVIQLVGRSELLVAIFSLLALHAALKPGWRNDLTIILAYLGAILSKEHGVVLIALIPVLDLFRTRTGMIDLLHKRGILLVTLVGITVAWLLYRHYIVHGGIPAPASLDPYYIPLAAVDAPTRTLAALKVQIIYLAKLLVPICLQGMYPQSTVVPFVGWVSPWGALIVAFLLSLVGAAYFGWQCRTSWALMVVYYVLSFLPTANIFFVAGFTMAERVAYLPSLWFCAGVSAALSGIPGLASRKRLVWCGTGGVITIYALAALLRFYDFRDLERYWLHDLKINPRNELSLLMLADHYRSLGRLTEAEARGRELTALAPDFKEGLSLYAGILVQMDRPEQAISLAQRAIELEKPGAVSSAKLPLAAAYLKLGRIDDAFATLQVVRITDRNQPGYWELYGKALEAKGDLVGALSCYRKEAASSGGRAKDGLRRLGKVLLQLDRAAEAVEYLRRDVRINPKAADGWNALGIALAAQGKAGEAGQAFAKAVELRPESMEYRANLQHSQRR